MTAPLTPGTAVLVPVGRRRDRAATLAPGVVLAVRTHGVGVLFRAPCRATSGPLARAATRTPVALVQFRVPGSAPGPGLSSGLGKSSGTGKSSGPGRVSLALVRAADYDPPAPGRPLPTIAAWVPYRSGKKLPLAWAEAIQRQGANNPAGPLPRPVPGLRYPAKSALIPWARWARMPGGVQSRDFGGGFSVVLVPEDRRVTAPGAGPAPAPVPVAPGAAQPKGYSYRWRVLRDGATLSEGIVAMDAAPTTLKRRSLAIRAACFSLALFRDLP